MARQSRLGAFHLHVDHRLCINHQSWPPGPGTSVPYHGWAPNITTAWHPNGLLRSAHKLASLPRHLHPVLPESCKAHHWLERFSDESAVHHHSVAAQLYRLGGGSRQSDSPSVDRDSRRYHLAYAHSRNLGVLLAPATGLRARAGLQAREERRN